MSETEPLDCPHGERCGGCAFLRVPYVRQLARKGAALAQDLARYPEHASLPIEPVAAAEPNRAYRVRAKLVFGKDGALGLYARNSHDVVDIPHCQVLAPALWRVSVAARRALNGLTPALDGLDLRLVDRGVMVTLIAPRGTSRLALEHLADVLRAASPDVCSLAASFRAEPSASLLGGGHVSLRGNEVEQHHVDPRGPYHLASHGAFAQAHLGQADAAHRAIEGELRALGAVCVLELYAGSGALSLRLASAGFTITCVEAFAPALAQIERAAREQRLTVSARRGDAEHVLGALGPARFDAVIVNPPRRGLSPEVRRRAAAGAPRAIVYMSCSPATLARDLAHLRLLGYAATRIAPFDMIPQSEAVECLVTLQPTRAPAPTVIYEDDQFIAVIKSGYERLDQGRDSLLARVRALPGASEAVVVAAVRLDLDSSGVCLFARTPATQPAFRLCPTFVALARGITHKKGHLRVPTGPERASGHTRYQRTAVHGGHSLLTLFPSPGSAGSASSLGIVRRQLAGIGHPILGDRRCGDPASNTFFEHRHGLDRSFLHCTALELVLEAGSFKIEAPLSGELVAALSSASEQAAPAR